MVADWCTEIRRALDFFYSTYPDDQIKKIVLSGGGGNIQELRQLLAVETSAEVETINPFQRFYIDSDKFDTEYLEKIAPQASICMGLQPAKWMTNDTYQFTTISSCKEKENIRRQVSIFFLSIIVVLLLVFWHNSYLGGRIMDLNKEISSTQAQVAKYKKINDEIAEIKRSSRCWIKRSM